MPIDRTLSMPDLTDAVSALAKKPRSAAIAADLVALLAEPVYTGQKSRRLWTAVLAGLGGNHATAASVAPLTALAADYQKVFGPTLMGKWLEEELRELVAALTAKFPAAPRTVKAVATAAPKTGSLDELYARVAADPDDDAPRRVLADKLMGEGDPRGEFIELQLRPTLTPAEAKRVKELLAKHEKAWLGPVAETTRKPDRVWRRGFLDACRIVARGKFLAQALGHPAWALVRVLEVDHEEKANAIVLHPVLRNVRALYRPHDDLLRALAVSTPPRGIQSLCCYVRSRGFLPELLAATGLPALRELELVDPFGGDDKGSLLRGLWKSRLGKQLRVLRFGVYPNSYREFAAEVRAYAPKKLDVQLSSGRVPPAIGAKPTKMVVAR